MSIFSNSELDEIFNFINHTKGMHINGKEITCFKDLYALTSNEEKISKISPLTVADYLEQVNLLKESYQAFGCTDCSLFDKLIMFLQNK